LVLRIFDALNDPIWASWWTNTHSRFGKFKPWILVGALVGGASMVLMFLDMGLTGAATRRRFAACTWCGTCFTA
jgi:melibiose permease/lactose/raffinose/galactose permease